MQKKDWLTISVGAITLAVSFITALVTLESRVAKLEAEIEVRSEALQITIDEMIESSKKIGRLEGEIDQLQDRGVNR